MTLSVHDVVAFFLTQSPGHLSMSLIHRRVLRPGLAPLLDRDSPVQRSAPYPGVRPRRPPDRRQESLRSSSSRMGMSGIHQGEVTHRHAPCIRALGRKTVEERSYNLSMPLTRPTQDLHVQHAHEQCGSDL